MALLKESALPEFPDSASPDGWQNLAAELREAQQAQKSGELATGQRDALQGQLKDAEARTQQTHQKDAALASNQRDTLEAESKTAEEEAKQSRQNAEGAVDQSQPQQGSSQRSPMLCQQLFQHLRREETRKTRFYRSKRLDRRRGPSGTKERTVRGRSGVREPRPNQPSQGGRSNSANWRSSGLGSGKS